MIYNNITPTANNYSLENQLLEQSQNGDFFKDPPKVVKNKAIFLTLLTILAISTLGLSYLAKRGLDIRGKAASAGSQISLLPASKNVILGEEFIISVSLNSGQDKVSAVDLKISYDPTAVVLSDFSIKDPMPHTLSPYKDNTQTGLISLVLAANPGKPFSGNGIIGTFKVKVINPKKSSLLFTADTKAAAFGKQVDSLTQKTGSVLSASTTLSGGSGSNVLSGAESVIKSTLSSIRAVTLSNTAPSIVTESLLLGSKGAAYSSNIVITKPVKTLSPSVDVSGLPFGLFKTTCADSADNLTTVCTISGTPTQTGLFGVLVTVTSPGQPAVSKTVSLQVK